MDTILFRDKRYRIGDAPATPLHLEHIAPLFLPAGWQEVDVRNWAPEREYGRGYHSQTGLRVLLTATVERDRKRWLHVSVSHRGGRLPTWREMCEVKSLFCGEDRTAYQVHPPASQHVSIHDKCLHLWCPLDGPVTPDFTRGGETI